MLYLVIIFFILLAILDRTLRGGRVRLLKLDLEFKLFALRDKLRNAAIDGEVPYNNWFDYMDTTLTRTLGRLEKLNPWLAVGYVWVHKDSVELRSAYVELKTALDENQVVSGVYNEYLDNLVWYLKRRYRISLPLAAMAFAFVCRNDKSKLHDTIEQEERELVPVFSITPETSTLWEHIRVPAAAAIATPGATMAV